MEVTDLLGLIATIVGIPAATYYPFMFAKVQWYKSDIGKSMITKGLSLALLFWGALLGIPATLFGWEAAHDWLMISIGWFLVFAVWYQVVIMRRVQKSGELHHRMGMEGQDADDTRLND